MQSVEWRTSLHSQAAVVRLRVDSCYFYPISLLLHDDIAGQHRPDLILLLQSMIGKRWIAGAQDTVLVKVNIQFFFQLFMDINYR